MSDDRLRETPLTLRLEYRDAANLLDQWRRNLSQGQTFVRTREALEAGTRLRLKVGFPGLREPFVLLGSVRTARVEGGEPGVDVAIHFADRAEQDRISTRIERAAAGDPELCARVVRLLVLEDNPHIGALITSGLQEVARRELRGRVTFEVECAPHGAAGLAALARDRFDMAVCDVYLPVMDGPQFIREVRAGKAPGLPILAVSAGGPAAREQAEAAGCDLFLEKPLRLTELVAAIRRLVRF
ncbi:MAG: response regulator [Deltaproteobacteria bacterium]|nr:response regulator [Deltaproteobacteria bacterium]